MMNNEKYEKILYVFDVNNKIITHIIIDVIDFEKVFYKNDIVAIIVIDKLTLNVDFFKLYPNNKTKYWIEEESKYYKQKLKRKFDSDLSKLRFKIDSFFDENDIEFYDYNDE